VDPIRLATCLDRSASASGAIASMVSACLPWRKLLSPAERRAPMVELAPARLIGPERAVKRFGRSARRRGSEDRGEAWADLEDDRGLGTEGRPFTSAIGRAAPFYEFNVSRDLARGSARRSCWLEELLDRFRPEAEGRRYRFNVANRRISLKNPLLRRPRCVLAAAVSEAKPGLCASCGEDRHRERNELRQFPQILGCGGQ
jgi:hypothetical protein